MSVAITVKELLTVT